MSKVTVVTDSNSGITQAQAKQLGINVLPMPFTIDNADYFEDIKHFENDFIKFQDNEQRLFAVSSSTLSKRFGIILWNKIYKKEINTSDLRHTINKSKGKTNNIMINTVIIIRDKVILLGKFIIILHFPQFSFNFSWFSYI